MKPQLNIKKEISAVYNGVKTMPGDRDNLPTKEHEFNVVTSGQILRYKPIKLLQYAAPTKGKTYTLGFETDDLYLPVSITVDGVLFYRETGNRIVSVDKSGKRTNHSDNQFTKKLGQSLRAYNLKLKAEGKEPIKPIRRRR